MISSKDLFASQRLSSSLDIFFLLGILLRNLVVAALEVVFCVKFADLKMPLGLLEDFNLLSSAYNSDIYFIYLLFIYLFLFILSFKLTNLQYKK